MDLYGRSPAPGSGLQESMWQMGLGGGEAPAYPERPGEPDCAYYLRTGTCGYGDRCRYNHPRDRGPAVGAARAGATAYPERAGQPVCQFFMKTGTCKFGPTCKYHHPRQGGASMQPVSLNYYGYPLRPDEKECAYYLRTGQCKFGSTCKFHHPQHVGVSAPSHTPVYYPTAQSASTPSPQQYPAMASWQVARPSVMPASYMQGPYGPMLLSPGVVPVPGWSPYPPPASPVLSPSGQQTVQAGSGYGLQSRLSPSATAYTGTYQPISSMAGPSSSMQKENMFPERPDQPDCQYYLRTGDCKFGATCKYHHPPGWSIPETNCILSPLGLPLRPSAPTCSFYVQHGICKFGPTCKFNHPMEILGYSPSASSLADMPVAPYHVGLSSGTLAPSSSSSDLRPELGANKDTFSIRIPSSDNTSSGSIGSMFSRGAFLPQSSGGGSSSSTMGHGGELPSSS